MTFDDRDDLLDARLRELARDYHEPPAPPREAMWAAIAGVEPRHGSKCSGVPGFGAWRRRRCSR
jgi:hypothetical protein